MKQVWLLIALIFFMPVVHAREDGLQNLADQLSEGLGHKIPLKVAVLALPHHDNRSSDGPLMVSERLTTLLAHEKNILIIERNHLVQTFQANGLSETGPLDSDTTKLMGQILGADVLVIGTLINLSGNKTEVNVRGINASTGQVLAAARALIDRNWDDRPVLAW